MVAQLLITYGPGAVDLIQKLVALWDKPSLTIDEINTLCSVATKSYASYISDAQASK